MTHTQLKIKDLWHKYCTDSKPLWAVKSLDLTINEGELVGLLGPSGCGKTTLLRLIAGFENPSRGEISIGDNVVASTNRFLPPERRGVGMVFQDCALFPHLDAWTNACFGLRKGQETARVKWLLDLLGLSTYRSRYPHELSGGQRQRLALARALAPGNSLVVLDEPFSSLDVDVRNKLRSELKGVLQSCSASGVLVTHDPQEALAICDRVAVMREGELHQCSTPTEIVNKPATPFVGRFVLQKNVLPVQNVNDQLSTPLGVLSIKIESTSSAPIELLVDEHSIEIEANNSGNAKVLCREFHGNCWLFRVTLDGHMLRVCQSLDKPLVKVGDRCFVKYKESHMGILFPGGTTCALK